MAFLVCPSNPLQQTALDELLKLAKDGHNCAAMVQGIHLFPKIGSQSMDSDCAFAALSVLEVLLESHQGRKAFCLLKRRKGSDLSVMTEWDVVKNLETTPLKLLIMCCEATRCGIVEANLVKATRCVALLAMDPKCQKMRVREKKGGQQNLLHAMQRLADMPDQHPDALHNMFEIMSKLGDDKKNHAAIHQNGCFLSNDMSLLHIEKGKGRTPRFSYATLVMCLQSMASLLDLKEVLNDTPTNKLPEIILIGRQYQMQTEDDAQRALGAVTNFLRMLALNGESHR
jgi:hypothetical protein